MCLVNDTTITIIPADIDGLVTFSPAPEGATIDIGGVRVAILYFACINGGDPSPVIDIKEG